MEADNQGQIELISGLFGQKKICANRRESAVKTLCGLGILAFRRVGGGLPYGAEASLEGKKIFV